MTDQEECSPRSAYETLKRLLHPADGPRVVELTILPSACSTTIQYEEDSTGSAIAIPHRVLIDCFCQARRVFLSSIAESETAKPPQEHGGAVSETAPHKTRFLNSGHPSEKDVFEATGILLLQEPNHGTAVNWRKKRLLSLCKQLDRAAFERTLQVELAFLTSLLASPLPPQHSKSRTLWSHRIWLSRTFTCESGSPVSDLTHEESFNQWWLQEIEVIEQAGDRHPRNYYSWCYARDLWYLISQQTRLLSRDDIKRRPVENSAESLGWPKDSDQCGETNTMLSSAIDRMHRWCFSHPRDISGWSFLIFLLQQLPVSAPSSRNPSTLHTQADRVVPTLINQTKDRITEFVDKLDWKGESVDWVLRELSQLAAASSEQSL